MTIAIGTKVVYTISRFDIKRKSFVPITRTGVVVKEAGNNDEGDRTVRILNDSHEFGTHSTMRVQDIAEAV